MDFKIHQSLHPEKLWQKITCYFKFINGKIQCQPTRCILPGWSIASTHVILGPYPIYKVYRLSAHLLHSNWSSTMVFTKITFNEMNSVSGVIANNQYHMTLLCPPTEQSIIRPFHREQDTQINKPTFRDGINLSFWVISFPVKSCSGAIILSCSRPFLTYVDHQMFFSTKLMMDLLLAPISGLLYQHECLSLLSTSNKPAML